jgi:hypothetical protein
VIDGKPPGCQEVNMNHEDTKSTKREEERGGNSFKSYFVFLRALRVFVVGPSAVGNEA